MWAKDRRRCCAVGGCDTGREVGPVLFEVTNVACFAVLCVDIKMINNN